MTRPKVYTLKCPYCVWERAHMFTDTLARMRNAHIKTTHKDKEER